jgi:hypothetical protein
VPLPEPKTTSERPEACLNCQQALGEPRPRFCPACGQETNVKPPTLREFAQQFGGAYFATEGALWRTLKLLLFKPGDLTRQYLGGRRKHFVLPLRLYLTISVMVLLAMRLGANLDIKTNAGGSLKSVTPAEMAREMHDFSVIEVGSGRAGLKQGAFFCENLPGWLCRRLQRRLDVDPKAFAAQVAELPERFIERFGSAMFLMVPLFALGLKLLYLKRGLRYTEHLVFALHLHAFWFIALACTLVPFKPVSGLAVMAMPVYAFLAARRVYGGRWWAGLLRGLAIFCGYATLLTLAMAVVGMWVFLS